MRISLFLIALCTVVFSCQNNSITSIDLSGEWQFQIDSTDQGVSEKWYEKSLVDVIILPGSMTANGKGDEVSVHTKWTGGVVDSSWYLMKNMPNTVSPAM